MRRQAGTRPAAEPDSSAAPPGSYRPDIDGLRAVAIVIVVGYHVGFPGFSGGFVGVDMFFAISGYLIIGLLDRELTSTDRIRWVAFYARRIRRLLPASLAMLLVLVPAGAILLSPAGEQQAMFLSAAAAMGFVSNLYFWIIEPTGYFAVPNAGADSLLHTWSLSVEEQFYLAGPAIFVLAWTMRRVLPSRRAGLTVSLTLLVAMSITSALWLGDRDASAGFYLPVSRAYEFALGGLTALFVASQGQRVRPRPRQAAAATGVCLLVLCMIFPLPPFAFPGAWALLPVIGTCLLMASGPLTEHTTSTPAARALTWWPVVGVGRLSYGWYLWHWPLIMMAAAVNMGPLPAAWRALLALVALGIAYLSHRFVERRFRVPPWRTTGKAVARASTTHPRAYLMGATATAVCLTVTAAAWWQADLASSSPTWTAVSDQTNDRRPLPSACGSTSELIMGDPTSRCAITPFEKAQPSVVLWGDSHAFQFLPALEAAAEDSDVNVLTWVAPGCPAFLGDPAEDVEVTHPGVAALYDDCVTRNRAAVDDVLALSQGQGTVRVVLAGRWPRYLGAAPISFSDRYRISSEYDESVAGLYQDLPSGLGALVERLARAGITADLVDAVPEMERPVPQCLASRWLGSCDVSRSRVDLFAAGAHDMLSDLARLSPTSLRVDPAEAVCDETACYAARGGIVNFSDDDHLSATRSRSLGYLFAPTIEALTRGPKSGTTPGPQAVASVRP